MTTEQIVPFVALILLHNLAMTMIILWALRQVERSLGTGKTSPRERQ